MVSRPSLGDQELKNVREVLASGWLGHGATVLEFEKQIQELLGGDRYVLAVSTGTSALHLALDSLRIGPGDEVIVPSLTFCGSVQAITALNAIPVFCEVVPSRVNIDVGNVKKCITDKTKAVMPVHFCGNACEMDSLLDLGREHGFAVVEDAAHAFGSRYKGQMIGSFGDITCFSFDPIKNITCGEGGAIVTANKEIADTVRRKRMLGMNVDGWERNSTNRHRAFEVNTQGYRYHMSNINAAIGLAQLPKLQQFCERRREIVCQYNSAFSKIPELNLLDWDLVDSCPFTYVLLVTDGKRDDLRSFLAKNEVSTGIHYIPNHLHMHFERYTRSLPVTEQIYRQLLTLPLYYEMTDRDVSKVIQGVLKFYK
jgi:perosamine synthetase